MRYTESCDHAFLAARIHARYTESGRRIKKITLAMTSERTAFVSSSRGFRETFLGGRGKRKFRAREKPGEEICSVPMLLLPKFLHFPILSASVLSFPELFFVSHSLHFGPWTGRQKRETAARMTLRGEVNPNSVSVLELAVSSCKKGGKNTRPILLCASMFHRAALARKMEVETLGGLKES